jgi:hypothetical protein
MQEWGFTRFGIDKYITTKFYNPERYDDCRNIFKALWKDSNGKKWEDYTADDLTMYGVPIEKFISLVTPRGVAANGIKVVFEGIYGIAEKDERKVNYDSNIVSIILLERITGKIGTRDNYCKGYQQQLSDLLLKIMNDDLEKASEDMEVLIESILAAGISGNNEIYSLTDEGNNSQSLAAPLISLVTQIYPDIPNEILSVGLNISNIFQNHEPIVTITHMMAQDSYYIDDYNETHSDRLYVVSLFSNADLFRAEFYGFNEMFVWKADNVNNWAEELINISSPNRLVYVEGYVLGRSDVHFAQPSSAVGYYSYVTEEKMSLFCPANHKYRISMKSYSKKPDHDINYQAYYQRIRVTGLISLPGSSMIPNKVDVLDTYSDNVSFNSDYVVRDVNAIPGSQIGTAFGSGSLIILIVAGAFLLGVIIYSVIYRKRRKTRNMN